MRDAVERALALRVSLLDGETDAVRLVDGEGDGLPGLEMDCFAGRWLLSTLGEAPPAEFVRWLERQGRPCAWKRLDPHQKESPRRLCGEVGEEPFLIRERGMVFEVSFSSGYSQGIFLDQRHNRAELRRLLRPGMKLLNTFAYTGAFSVAGALAGAETTTLDLSQPYLDWARRNFQHNGLDPGGHYFCKGDTFHWLRRFAKSGRRFDAVVLDPPTFSRDESGRVFRAERDFGELAALAARVLVPGGYLLCCTNFRGITPARFERMIRAALPGGAQAAARHEPMPPDFTARPPYLKSLWIRPGGG